MTIFTWYYSTDGRARPADTGDDDKAEALILQPRDGHIIRITWNSNPRSSSNSLVSVPVTFCKRKIF